jgi:hypothetical protein
MLRIRMRERRLLSFLLVGPCFISACALIADLGDRTLGDPSATNPTTEGGTGKNDGGDNEDDGSSGGEDTNTPLANYCEGITLYASFDSALTGERNGSAVSVIGGVTQVAGGKYGGAASLVQTDNNGAQLFFLVDGGVSPYPEKVGSIAVWYRPAPGKTPAIPVLYRPVANLPPYTGGLKTAGLAFYLRFDPPGAGGLGRDLLGLVHVIPNGAGGTVQTPVLMADSGATTTYLRAGEFNHYFASWNQSSSPTAVFALNGGVGTNFGGGAAETYPDANTPFRSTTGGVWSSEGAPVALRLGGAGGTQPSESNSPEGSYDDLVVWNRVVPLDQLAALYNSAKPVGEVCKLK